MSHKTKYIHVVMQVDCISGAHSVNSAFGTALEAEVMAKELKRDVNTFAYVVPTILVERVE